jgi:hypothetical protein
MESQRLRALRIIAILQDPKLDNVSALEAVEGELLRMGEFQRLQIIDAIECRSIRPKKLPLRSRVFLLVTFAADPRGFLGSCFEAVKLSILDHIKRL